MTDLRFSVLGSVALKAGDVAVALGGARQRALLALLLLHANRVVAREEIIEALWGHDPPAGGAHAVETAVSRLRRALREAGAESRLVTRGSGYEIRVDADELDLARFEELIRAAHGLADPRERAALLREALSLWSGSALADVDAPFQQQEGPRLAELRLTALEDALAAEVDLENSGPAVAELQRLAVQHPLRERPRALLMLGLYRTGRQPEALDVYRRTRHELADELGIEPSPELRQLEHAILRQDPDLLRPAQPHTARAEAPVSVEMADSSSVPAQRPPPSPRRPPSSPRRRALLVSTVAAIAAVVLLLLLLVGRGGTGPVAANAAVLVRLGGGTSRQVPVGAEPQTITSGAGWLWTANEADGTVSRIDPGNAAVDTLSVGPDPRALSFGAGFLWVADGGGRTISEVNPEAAKVVRTVVVGNGPAGIAFGGGGVWVAAATDGTLLRVDAASGRRGRPIPVGTAPGPVAYGAGAVWVGITGAGTVVRVDPGSGTVVQTVTVGNNPAALAIGAGGVWVANADDHTVSRIDPTTDTVQATIPVGGTPTALAVQGGNVWVALASGQALVEIDGQRGRVTRRLLLGKPVSAVAVIGPTVWATTLPAPRAHRGGTLTVRADSFSFCNCVDPATAVYPSEWQLLDLAYDGLVAYRRTGGPAGAQLVGDLAMSVPPVSSDGRSYVFRMRPGVHFSNGQLVRPSDVSATFRRLLTINRINLPPSFYGQIIGSAQCHPGRCDLSRGLVADDRSGTVTFHLQAPDPDFLYRLALPFAFVLPAQAPLRVARSPIAGTGPYEITHFAPNRQLALARNPRFRVFAPAATPDGYPDRIVATVTPSPDQQLGMVLAGRADVSTGLRLSPASLAALSIRHPDQLHSDPGGGTAFLFLNTRTPPFDDLRARRAMNYAVDRHRLARLLYGAGAASATCQVLPPEFPGYEPYCPYSLQPSPAGTPSAPDLRRAQRLVASSGTRGDRVIVPTFGRQLPAAAYTVRVLSSLGYRASTRVFGSSDRYYAFAGSAHSGAQIGLNNWLKDYTSAADFFQPLFSCPGPNQSFTGLCDPVLTQDISSALQAQVASLPTANQAWATVDRRVVDIAATVPVANPLSLTVVAKRVLNYQFNPEWGPLLDQLWVQ
jgi:peptide/nickel transport system substrate-binding protein